MFFFLLDTLFIAVHVFVYLHKSKYSVNLMKCLMNFYNLIILCIYLYIDFFFTEIDLEFSTKALLLV